MGLFAENLFFKGAGGCAQHHPKTSANVPDQKLLNHSLLIGYTSQQHAGNSVHHVPSCYMFLPCSNVYSEPYSQAMRNVQHTSLSQFRLPSPEPEDVSAQHRPQRSFFFLGRGLCCLFRLLLRLWLALLRPFVAELLCAFRNPLLHINLRILPVGFQAPAG